MSEVTAIILSKSPVERNLPRVVVLPFISRFSSSAGLLASRLAAIEQVTTPWFFFLDDDDDLPNDYERVLERCLKVKTPLAYTDEIITNADGTEYRRKASKYNQDKHIADMTLIHHLVVCRTDAALEAIKVIPRGTYAIENLLFFQVAKKGATYINEVGYFWHRRDTGLHRDPSMLTGLIQSATWANRNRT